VVRGTDCNDDPAMGGRSARPGEREACDGIDNDCDGNRDNVPTTGTDESCIMGSPEEPCYDAACGGRAGTRACVNCIRTACQASLPRCTPGPERQECMIPGSSCVGHRTCNASCQFTACAVDAEVCNYRDDNCDGRVDEGLGRTCDQTFQRGVARALDLTAEWTPLYEAARNAASDAMTLLDARRRVGAATLSTPFPLAGDVVITGRVMLGSVALTRDGTIILEVYVTTRLPTGMGTSVAFPADTVGYRVDVDLWRAAAANAVELWTINGGMPTRIGAGMASVDVVGVGVGLPGVGAPPIRHDFRLQIRSGTLSYGIAWAGREARINVATDPRGAALVGLPMYVTVAMKDTYGRTLAELVGVDLHRGAAEPAGGPCADSTPPEPYCPR
jgi:hypothetical protein